MVIIGIDDNKTVSGYAIGKETVQQILNEIKNKTSPSITPDIEAVKYRRKALLIITVFEYPLKPVSFKGRYYKRIANSNHQLNLPEVVQLHNYTYNSSWDYALDSNHSLSDISLNKVNRFIRMTNKIRLTPIDEKPEDVLKKFELCRDNKISLACFLLFNEAGSILSTVELGRFANDITIIDSLTLRDDLFSQVDSIIAFLGKHLKKAYIITGNAQREEKFEYPPEALREIVLNMIIHRDYAHSGDSIIKIFDNRIEFFNPGSLLPPLTIDKLLSGDYASNTRNKQIANLFKEAGLIEKYGSGIKRIKEAFVRNGFVAPRFEVFQHGFKVTVFNEKLHHDTDHDTDKRREKIIKLLRTNNKLPIMKLATIMKVSKSTILRDLDILKQTKTLKRRGTEKNGYWEIE